jgi:hypothetical protein
MRSEDGQLPPEHRQSFVARTAGTFKSGRPPLSPEQEQVEFERGVADDQASLAETLTQAANE